MSDVVGWIPMIGVFGLTRGVHRVAVQYLLAAGLPRGNPQNS
jgi:hypothetical protein